MKPSTVVLVHGMFMTPRCFAAWVPRLEARGYRCVVPAWPHHDGEPAAIRAKHPDAALGGLSLAGVLAAVEPVVRASTTPPVLIGHSMGGLVVQLLLQRGLGASGVAIDSAPPNGVTSLAWSFLKANWPVINPLTSADAPFLPSIEQFAYAFAHKLPPDRLRATYDEQVVPESRRVGRAALTDVAKIDFAASRPPLLFLAGEDDHIIPADLNRKNHAKYAQSPSITELRVMPGRTHSLILDEGWEEVADAAIEWAERVSGG